MSETSQQTADCHISRVSSRFQRIRRWSSDTLKHKLWPSRATPVTNLKVISKQHSKWKKTKNNIGNKLPEIWAAWGNSFCWSINRSKFLSQLISTLVQIRALSSPPVRTSMRLRSIHWQSKLLMPDWWMDRLPKGSMALSSSTTVTSHTASRPSVPAEKRMELPSGSATTLTSKTQQLWKLSSWNKSNRPPSRDRSKILEKKMKMWQ